MNPIIKKILKEWERSLLSITLLGVCLCLACFAYMLMNAEDRSGNDRSQFRTPHVYFDATSRVYMDGPALDKNVRSPMFYSLKLKIPSGDKPTGKPKVADKPKVVDKPKVADKPKVVDKPKVADKPKVTDKPKVADKPKPTEPPVRITVKYRGCMQLSNDLPVAFCTSKSSKEKVSQYGSLRKGDKVHGMILVDSFDENELTLSHDGRKVTVPRGKEHVFTMEAISD